MVADPGRLVTLGHTSNTKPWSGLNDAALRFPGNVGEPNGPEIPNIDADIELARLSLPSLWPCRLIDRLMNHPTAGEDASASIRDTAPDANATSRHATGDSRYLLTADDDSAASIH